MDTLSGESSKLGQQRSQHLHRTLNSPVEYPTALPQDQYGLPTRGLTTQNLDAPQLPVEDYPVQTFSGFPEHSRAPDGYPLSTAWFPAGPSRSQSEGKSPTAMYEDFYQQRAAHLAHGYQLPRTFCPAGPSRSQDEGMQPNAPNHHMPQQGTVDVAQESLLFGQLTPFPAEPWSTQHHGVQSSTPEQRPFHPHSPSRRRVHLANQPPLQGPSPTCRQVNVACLEDPFVEASAGKCRCSFRNNEAILTLKSSPRTDCAGDCPRDGECQYGHERHR